MSILIYLAGGMEHAEDGITWRANVTEELAKIDVKTWDPYLQEQLLFNNDNIEFLKAHDKVLHTPLINARMRKIVQHDMSVVAKDADMLMVKLDNTVLKGAGTQAEMSLAAYLNKPVHVWITDISISSIPYWLIGCMTYWSYDFEDVINRVKKDCYEITTGLAAENTF